MSNATQASVAVDGHRHPTGGDGVGGAVAVQGQREDVSIRYARRGGSVDVWSYLAASLTFPVSIVMYVKQCSARMIYLICMICTVSVSVSYEQTEWHC